MEAFFEEAEAFLGAVPDASDEPPVRRLDLDLPADAILPSVRAQSEQRSRTARGLLRRLWADPCDASAAIERMEREAAGW